MTCCFAMRHRSIGIIFGSLFVWGIITYFLFLNQPNGKDQDKSGLPNRISLLRSRMKQEFTINEGILQKIKNGEFHQNQSHTETSTVPTTPNESKNQDGNNVIETTKNNTLENNDLKTKKVENIVQRKKLADGSPIIAVLVFSCDRVTVRRCLDQLIKLRPNAQQFPLIVSQDCDHEQTAKIIERYSDQVMHIKQPDQTDIDIPPKEKKFKGYFKIARHYGWALDQVFLQLGYDTAIIVEDDLDVAPDFFEYFLGTYPLLVKDPSLWCVSAWNDNGKAELVDENSPDLLYRTDFFPGLGWMLRRELWLELQPKWPKAYWDDWIRKPEQRKDRACIRPGLSRTKTFGKVGVSNGLFYEKYLKFIKLNEKFVPFTKMNLTYLLKDNYDISFGNEVYRRSTVVSDTELKKGNIMKQGPVRIPYYNRQVYKSTAKSLGLMDDFRSGVPRTGYRGVVTFYYKGRKVHLAPRTNWNGYDVTWS